MPVASPDTTYNEAPVDPTNNEEHEEDLKRVSDKNNSLRKLIHFIKSNYSSNLNTPKWKNFNGLKLLAKDKVRLNNVIWRTWFQQCIIFSLSFLFLSFNYSLIYSVFKME
jgi:hypothetical protein